MKELTNEEIEVSKDARAGFISVGEVEAIGSVRYEKTVSIGEKYVTETIEGNTDDVLKVIKALGHKQAASTFNFHIEAPEIRTRIDATELTGNIKKEIRNAFEKLTQSDLR